MTTAYAERPQQARVFPPAGHLRLVLNTAPAQGPDAAKMLRVMQGFRRGTAARGQSLESVKVFTAFGQLQLALTQHIESLRELVQGHDDLSYHHIPLKPVFSVQATFEYVGKIKPRQFPLDE